MGFVLPADRLCSALPCIGICMACLNLSMASSVQDGATVLHFAARNANSFAIKAMLRHDADINACDSVSLS